jgi:carbamoylphosphate synthase small subunit
MRAWELLKEDEDAGDQMVSDLKDLLIAAKASGIEDIDTESLVTQLNDMGHSVTQDSLVDVLDDLDDEFIKNVTLNDITLKSHTAGDGNESENEWEDQEADAGRIANKTAMKGVKKNAQQTKRTTKDAQL